MSTNLDKIVEIFKETQINVPPGIPQKLGKIRNIVWEKLY